MKKKELEFILQDGEGLKIEFKESLNNIDKEMVAFANGSGGKIFLGVSDQGKIKGVNISNHLKSQIQDTANNCDPPVKIKLEQLENILIISVEEGIDKPYRCSSGFYIRQGPNSQKLTRDEIIKLVVKAGKVFFDELQCEKFNFRKDFDKAKFEQFLKMAKLSNILSIEQALINLSLATKEKNKLVANNAGAMLFAKDLNEIYFHTLVTCVRFKGSQILDRKDYNKDIISNIESAVNFVLQYLQLRYEIKGLQRKEHYEIPEEAVREAVVNSIVHRDYFEKGANVQINIYDDKIEIINPGGLVSGLQTKDFGKKSLSRNPLLLSILNKAGFVEKIGTGIRRIKESLKDNRLKEPIFDFNGVFSITLLRPAPQKTPQKVLTRLEKKILDEISKNPATTRRLIAKSLQISPETVKEYIKKLKQYGSLKRIGPAKGGYWKVP
ncbi:MAG: ATP-binding protein [Nanoarchaeota archaeon]